jgi:hypothetical protein
MVNSKHAFWQALIVTILIFGVGLVFGYFLEASRADGIEMNLLASEVNVLDEQLRGGIVGESNISCDLAVKSTFAFADKIYEEAVKLEKYDASSKFNRDALKILHKRYDLLRMMLWTESIKLEKRCGGFHNVVYFFDYDPQEVELRAEQAFFSRLLVDLKNDSPDKVLLIPIAANLDLASVDIVLDIYEVSKTPAILVDEKRKADYVITLEELEGMVFANKTVKAEVKE